MLRLLADENFNGDITRALRRRRPDIDLLTVQDVGIDGADDPAVLEFAAGDGRVLTHDVNTVPGFAFDRVRAGLGMPGVVEIASDAAVGPIVDELLLFAECSLPGEWEGQVIYLPL